MKNKIIIAVSVSAVILGGIVSSYWYLLYQIGQVKNYVVNVGNYVLYTEATTTSQGINASIHETDADAQALYQAITATSTKK